MKVSKKLQQSSCQLVLKDPKRLNAAKLSGQLNAKRNKALDRLSYLASKILRVPLTIISIVGEDKQYFKSFHGLGEPWATNPQVPIDVSVCQYTLVGEILSLSDVRRYPELADNPAVAALNMVGYLGIPLITKKGHNLGAFCAISTDEREWSDEDIETLKILTESAMAELELQTKINQLTKSQENWKTTVALLTHDLRSPIATAYSFAELAMTQNRADITSQALESIHSTTGKALKLIENHLDQHFSTTHHKIDIDLQPLNLNELFLPMVKDFSTVNHVSILHNLEEKSITTMADEDALYRAVSNLLSNAFKHGDPKRPITFNIDRNATTTSISVHNYGRTLSDEEIKKIFKPGETVSSQAEKNDKSWGLGLAAVKSVIKAHEGKVHVKSNADFGTEFCLEIPSGV